MTNALLRLGSNFFTTKSTYNFIISLNPCPKRDVRLRSYINSKFILYANYPRWFKQICYLHNDVKQNLIDFNGTFSEDEQYNITKNMLVIESFLSADEEKSLLDEIEPYMKRLRYEFNHWDNAIHGFRETERLNWNQENTKIINRVRDCAFPPGSPQLHHVHILDLAEEGYIKPHIDSDRFCGNTIAGLSLLTDAVMRLVHDKDNTKIVDVLLKRHSLYIMRDSVRYDYTHEVLPFKDSKFKQEEVTKRRRISIICRNEPSFSVSDE